MTAMRRPPPWLRSGRVLCGAALVLAVLAAALAAPWVAPHDPNNQDLLSILLPPAFMAGGNPADALGTDSLGRDVLSRLMFGARTALEVAVFAAAGRPASAPFWPMSPAISAVRRIG
jgi:peptide/nickel transport system permease protein